MYLLFANDTIVAQCVVSKGGGRYSFANKNDIVVGPYFVRQEFRGNHYSELLVNCVLYKLGLKYEDAYDWIAKNNEPSIKCSKKCGFKIVGTISESKYLRLLKKCDEKDGNYYLFKLEK